MLKGFKEAPVSGGGSLCRMVLLLYAEGIEGGPFAERRPQCRREEALCRPEEAPVPRGGPRCRKVFCAERIGGGPVSGGGSCADRRPSVLVGPVLCAERIEGGPYAEKRPLCH